MKSIRISFLLIFLAGGCRSSSTGADCIDQAKVNPDTMCIELYQPVCGCDSKTYSNDCVAQKNGVTSWKEGECPGQ